MIDAKNTITPPLSPAHTHAASSAGTGSGLPGPTYSISPFCLQSKNSSSLPGGRHERRRFRLRGRRTGITRRWAVYDDEEECILNIVEIILDSMQSVGGLQSVVYLEFQGNYYFLCPDLTASAFVCQRKMHDSSLPLNSTDNVCGWGSDGSWKISFYWRCF